MTRPDPPLRPTVRVLLSDDAGRYLLFLGSDPANPAVSFWFPPGGGVEDGETFEQAAARELLEETGLRDVPLGPHVWNRRHVVSWGGEVMDIREAWFLAQVPAFDVDVSGFTDLEAATIAEHRWWSVAELRATADSLTPSNLVQLLDDLDAGGTPDSPLSIGP